MGLAAPEALVSGEAKSLAEVERDYITAVLRAAGGNRTKAAAALGIGPATLYRKLKEYDQPEPVPDVSCRLSDYDRREEEASRQRD